MGYTTEFTGIIRLGRALSADEAAVLEGLHDDPEVAENPVPGNYFQWVATADRCGIVWDGEEKFYEYVACMRWLCAWLAERGIWADGELRWVGDEPGDRGILRVVANEVSTEMVA